MRKIFLLATVLLVHSTSTAGIFSWIDASGNTVYGDNPPDTAVAQAVAPPKLTILENFANRYEDLASTNSSGGSSRRAAETGGGMTFTKKVVDRPYTALKVIAPKADQSIRANDGDVSIALSLSPKLRPGDKVVIYLNGERQTSIRSRVANLTNLGRGEYKLLLEIQNKNGESLLKSSETSFNVLRNSVLTNKTKPYNPYQDDPSQ